MNVLNNIGETYRIIH